MKKIITVALLASMLLALTSCKDTGSSNVKSFYYRLRGKWESSTTDVYDYYGELEITSNRITITGYEKPPLWYGLNDDQRPFKDLPKGRSMPGYSEEYKEDGITHGKIFIENGDKVESFDYIYWEDNPPGKGLTPYLRFKINGRDEDLDYIGP